MIFFCRNLPSSFQPQHGYHQSCYSKFTAVPKTQTHQNIRSRRESGDKLLRSDVESTVAGASGLFKEVCIFCKQKTKSKGSTGVERLGSSEALDAEERIKEAACILEDHGMMTEIGDVDFVAKEVKYHHSCRKIYLNKAERIKQQSLNREEKKDSEYHKLRSAHDRAFADIIGYTQEAVIDHERVELLTSLHEMYMVYLAEHGCCDSNYNAQTLGSKLLKHFKGSLQWAKQTEDRVMFCIQLR